MKTSELTGAALDWAVAKCEGQPNNWMHDHKLGYTNSPSTDWAQGGPIIERENIKLTPRKPFHDDWEAEYRYSQGGGLNAFGPTPLIAAMRCLVASKLGDEVDVPEELNHD